MTICFYCDVKKMQAEPDTDEVYAQVMLLPQVSQLLFA